MNAEEITIGRIDAMASIPGLEAHHVTEAMAEIRKTGIPPKARSTKFDVLHPDGTPFPPKLVLSLAAKAATGRPLSRRDFSGGEETNAPLKNLGFTVTERKPGAMIGQAAPGDILTNDQVSQAFNVGNAGGMRWSSAQNCLVIVADHTKALYDDRWEDDVFHYTGMGRVGDQALTGQNKRLAEQQQTDIQVHLFEVFRQGDYIYVGQMRLVGEPHRERQLDDSGDERWVYVFPLRLAEDASRPTPALRDVARIEEERQRALAPLSVAELAKRARLGGQQKPSVRQSMVAHYERNAAVAELVKRLANGTCDLCLAPAPFVVDGVPYLECHHVMHLAKGGPDTIENTVALCPNCHRRMHALDRAADRKRLISRMQSRVIPEAGG
jgi:5-methylcytosine-specific restriction enzyme A